MAREAMEYDVVIVGGGPAGLAAAIRLKQLAAERKQIDTDQDRIRRNLQSVGQASDLGRQYIETLKKQEDRLSEIARQEKALEAEIAARRQSAEQIAQKLTF